MNALIVTTFGGLVMLGGLFVLGHEAGTSRITEIVAAPADGHRHDRRRAAHPRRRDQQVGARAVPLLAAGGDGRAHPRERLPARRRHGQGRRLPRRAARPGLLRHPRLAPAAARHRHRDDAPRRAAGAAPARHQAAARLRHGEPARLPHRRRRRGHAGRRPSPAWRSSSATPSSSRPSSSSSGVIDRSTGTRDLRELTGLLPLAARRSSVPPCSPPRRWPASRRCSASPPRRPRSPPSSTSAPTPTSACWGPVALVGLVLGSTLTVAYTARFLWGAFGVRDVTPPSVTPARAGLLAAPVVLAGLSLVGGLAGAPLTSRLMAYAGEFPAGCPRAAAHAVARLHPGPGPVGARRHRRPPALGRPAPGVVGAGPPRRPAARARGRDRLPRASSGRWTGCRSRSPAAPSGARCPVYLGIILLVLVVVPGITLVRTWEGVALRGPDNLLQVAIVVVVIVAAILTVRSRRRLRAVLLLGVTGYGTALLFVAHGAPDLALTQVLVETFSVVTFVLVMRRLPPFFSDRPFTAARRIRVAVGCLTGLAVGGYALLAADARTASPGGQRLRRAGIRLRRRQQHRQHHPRRHPGLGHLRRDRRARRRRDRRREPHLPAHRPGDLAPREPARPGRRGVGLAARGRAHRRPAALRRLRDRGPAWSSPCS